MTPFEKAIVRARELDISYPQFSHIVGFRLNIIRIKNVEEDISSEGGYTSCGACCGYGCDHCMPHIHLEEEQ